MRICDFDESKHLDRLRECVVELQESERLLDPRMPAGADIVDKYIPKMLERCIQSAGKILIAEIDGEVAGFATILTRVSSAELEDGDVEYGLVSDLMVAKTYRRQGLGRKLLEAAELDARAKDVQSLTIGVLTGNKPAYKHYSLMGWSSR